jgi:hypothetical protein
MSAEVNNLEMTTYIVRWRGTAEESAKFIELRFGELIRRD